MHSPILRTFLNNILRDETLYFTSFYYSYLVFYSIRLLRVLSCGSFSPVLVFIYPVVVINYTGPLVIPA